MTQEELDREAEEADRQASEMARAQRECGHYNCEPAEWYWSGQVRVMRCNDCGLEDFRDEVVQ